MDWAAIGGNIAATLTVVIVVARLVKRDRRDQKLIRQINGLAEALSRCMYAIEGGTRQEDRRSDEHTSRH